MTTYPTELPDLAAPPAPDGEDPNVLNGLVTEDLPLLVDVPPIALRDDEKIVRHPDDGTEVDWKVTARRRDDDGRMVVEYRTGDGAEDSYTFTAPDRWVRVEVGQVQK